MKTFLTWVDRVAAKGAIVSETESHLTLTLPLAGATPEQLRQALTPPPPAVLPSVTAAVDLALEGPTLPYLYDSQELELQEPWWEWGCDLHRDQYLDLLGRQGNEWIEAGERLALVHGMAACERCHLKLHLRVQVEKRAALLSLLRLNTSRTLLPEEVELRFWLRRTELRKAYTPVTLLHWPDRPVLFAVRWDWNPGSDFVRSANVERQDFWSEILMAAEMLAHMSQRLPALRTGFGARLPGSINLLPAGYWVSDRAALQERLEEDLLDDLHGAELLALSLLAQSAGKVERQRHGDEEQLTFCIERERRVTLAVRITSDGIWLCREGVAPEGFAARDRSPELVKFYATAYRGVRLKGNQALVQAAILLAADGDLAAVLTQTERILIHYRFQHDTLFEERFKQNFEVSKLYLTQWLDARSKIGAMVGDLYKTLAAVATALGGLAAAATTKAIEQATFGNTKLLAGGLLGLLYVPAHFLWVDNTMEESLNRLRDFQAQMSWSADMLNYPGVTEKLTRDVRQLVRDLIVRVFYVLLYFAAVFSLGLWLAWHGFHQRGPKEPVLLDKTWFLALFWGGMALVLVLGVVRVSARLKQVWEITGVPAGSRLGWLGGRNGHMR